MVLIDKLFRKTTTDSTQQEPEQTLIIRFRYGINGLEPLHRLEQELEELIKKEGVGEYDGHEIAIDYSDGYLYMYGPNAVTLFKTIQPALEKSDFIKGGIAKLRFGPPENGVKEIEVKLKE
ncbi:hypothetical protein OO013_07675 [Mangrovivirga sp. M17]|uniref:Uncharacterized protein n=1 Tax=Mangrovivirga halotolerans TaxID=2993936 RepID=A0ABT3RPL8_9BACT|nr:hypothetical protein [Mangrovivirga halotolerans]MCX2743738.1 hypothetical protein [Mangrovivirga halotolerans]